MKIFFTGFSPNLTRKGLKKALGYLFLPWKWKNLRSGPRVEELEHTLAAYIGTKYAFSFDSGRSALYVALSQLGLGPGDEVLLQAYTCVVVVNAIRWTGARPVFVDIENDFTMDFEDASSKITDKSKAVIIQHTFGNPSRFSELISLFHERHLKIVEDCAHAIGATWKGEKLGSFGDIAIFSFGSDKVISSARGGALTLNDPELAYNIKARHDSLPRFPLKKLIQHLLHIPIFYLGRASYGIGLGKCLLYISKKMHITNRIIEDIEKRGERPSYVPSQFSNSLADILLGQFENLEASNQHRKMIAHAYKTLIANKRVKHPPESETGIFLRYAIRVPDPKKLALQLKKEGIMAGDWYTSVVAPADVSISDYTPGFCPRAEALSAATLNLPTDLSITKSDAEYISTLVNTYA